MAYLSLNFVVPDNLECADSIEVISVGGDQFFLRFNYAAKYQHYFHTKHT